MRCGGLSSARVLSRPAPRYAVHRNSQDSGGIVGTGRWGRILPVATFHTQRGHPWAKRVASPIISRSGRDMSSKVAAGTFWRDISRSRMAGGSIFAPIRQPHCLGRAGERAARRENEAPSGGARASAHRLLVGTRPRSYLFYPLRGRFIRPGKVGNARDAHRFFIICRSFSWRIFVRMRAP